jgi:hypothetical protein
MVTKSSLSKPRSDPERIQYWMQIVNTYTKAFLTHPTDKLPAISGLAFKFQHIKLQRIWLDYGSKAYIGRAPLAVYNSDVNPDTLPSQFKVLLLFLREFEGGENGAIALVLTGSTRNEYKRVGFAEPGYDYHGLLNKWFEKSELRII